MARPEQRRPASAARYKGSPRPAADPARAAALEVLRGVDERDAYANLLLARILERAGLSGRDAAFATELSAGTLRMRGLYDAVLAGLVGRPLSGLDPVVLDVLRLGSHQILSMRVPPHAAVSTSVDLIRATVGPRPAGLVNAVLRKVAGRDTDTWVQHLVPDGADPLDRLVVRHSHPRWIVEGLQQALAAGGADRAELPALLAADNLVAGLTLVARPGLVAPDELLVGGARPGRLSPFAVRLDGGNPADLAAVRERRAGVQDEGSQVVAWLCTQAPLPGRDESWLDLCAGPGGKAALLGAIAAKRGAGVLANEVQPHRAELVRQAVAALPNVSVTVQDGRRASWQPASFDRVLVDAPCTGTGALRRRPEARWRRQAGDLQALVRLQRELLMAALDAVRPGGVVVYATCSPLLAETSEVVDWVVQQRPEVSTEPVVGVPPDARTRDGSLQLWPHRHDTDAMFAAVLRRAPVS